MDAEVLKTTLEVVAVVIGIIGTVFGILGISGYLGERAKHKAEKKNKQEDQAEEQLQAMADLRLKNTVREVFKEETICINDKLDTITGDVNEIKRDLADNTKGTVTILRNDMKKSLDFCKRQGYASSSDRANWHELYNTYGELGGNHFKEFVDAWKQEFDSLPSTPPETSPKKRVSKSSKKEDKENK